MANQRTDMHRLQDLVRLHRMGERPRSAARQLKMGPNTARAYREALRAAGLLDGSPTDLPEADALRAAIDQHLPKKPAPQEESSIEIWTEQIEALLKDELKPKAIFDRLRLEHGQDSQAGKKFAGSFWAVRRMCRRLRRHWGASPEEIAIAVETAPGEVAQVDFGEIGKLFDPEQRVLRRAWVFVMVLGFSRHMFAKVVFDQKTETWLELHAEAFRALQGVPRVMVPDNLKAAVIRAAFGASDDPSLNRSYREFARHYGFKIDPTPAYAPKKKGKVESGVKYVKNNALAGREGEAIEEVNKALERWVREIAGSRTHGTTGKPPLELFEQVERQALLAMPTKRWDPVVWKQASLHQDAHLCFDGALYSAPWRLVVPKQKLWVRATSRSVEIYGPEDQRVATHRRGKAGSRNTIEEHLPEGRRELRHRSRGYWEERASALGPEVGAFVKEVFDSDDVLYQLRAVQAIVTYLEKFPTTRARAACERARFYGNYTYGGVKRILTQALDLEPLPTAMVSSTESRASFRFARNVAELMHARIEERHEPQ
jgi:transposase